MRDSLGEAGRWLAQAEYDLSAAGANLEAFPALACYLAQQAAEKAVKALLYLCGQRTVFGHSVVELLDEAAGVVGGEELSNLAPRARTLDRYYIPTRYPNGLPGGIPAESFTTIEAGEATAAAQLFVDLARTRVKSAEGEADA